MSLVRWVVADLKGPALQLARFSSPTCCYFPMECRRWASTCSTWLGFPGFSLVILMDYWVDGLGLAVGTCRAAGEWYREDVSAGWAGGEKEEGGKKKKGGHTGG
jgi:hypothetical protein